MVARKLPITQEQIEQAKINTERPAIKLDPPLWVDINYDTQVIESGVLHLYPDVYKPGKEEVSNLQQELASTENLQVDAKTLQKMLEQVTQKQEFVVSIAEIKAGRALIAGRLVPLVNTLEPSS